MPVSTLSEKLRGYQGQLYYNAVGGTQKIFAHLSAWEIDVKADSIDFTDHSTSGWKDKGSGLKEFSGTISAIYLTNDPDKDAFFDALSGATDLLGDFRPIDIVGETNYTGTISITGYKQAAKGSDAQAVDITFDGRSPLVRGQIVAPTS
jgi:predicted secreted protein